MTNPTDDTAGQIARVSVDAILDRLIDAHEPADVLAALDAAFGPGASLFIIDHDFLEVRFVDDGRTIPLDGPLADALSEAVPVTTDHGWWLPIPERNAVTLGLLYASPPDDDTREPLVRRSRRIGLCTPMLRARFEDFEQRRRSHDMSVAAELQWSLLPPRAGTAGGFNFASALEPAYDVAGDLFDYSFFDDALWVYSLDAMGHGMEATLSGVIALTAIRNARREGRSLVEQIAYANEAVHEQWGGRRFVTGVGCRLTTDGISVVNAGHEPLRRRRGERIEGLSVAPSIPLGIEASTTYETHSLDPLMLGDSLILLSDGSAEARNAAGSPFGTPAVDAALEASWNASPLRAARSYLKRILDYSDGGRPGDDITAVIISVDAVADAGGHRSILGGAA